ncbi:MAG: hypothetical protein DWQ37_06810 [Planctomycetota bacterium]|nr:MAG: hypothetical protein DWQ37_06810 [Planctomycetota bacterium]
MRLNLWIGLVAGSGLLIYGLLFDPKFPSRGFLVAAAIASWIWSLWNWLAIRWLDRNKAWNSVAWPESGGVRDFLGFSSKRLARPRMADSK